MTAEHLQHNTVYSMLVQKNFFFINELEIFPYLCNASYPSVLHIASERDVSCWTLDFVKHMAWNVGESIFSIKSGIPEAELSML
jgi:hypothetical protein